MVNTYTDGACALKLPSSYVPMTSEEMEYLEGGRVNYYTYRAGDKSGVTDLYATAAAMATACGLSALTSKASTALFALNPAIGIGVKWMFRGFAAYTGYLAKQCFSAAQTAEARYYRGKKYTIYVNTLLSVPTNIGVE